MKTLIKTLSLLVACACLCVPTMDGQDRGRNRGGQPQHTSAPNRAPGGGGGNHQGGQRPGGFGGGNSNNHQPSVRPGGNNNNNHQPNVRPGGNNNNHQPSVRPGGFQTPQRPGGGNNHAPNMGPRPGHGPVQGYRPGPVQGFGHIHFGVPNRPMMPPPQPYRRPVPPARYVPFGHSMFSTILGVTIGTALNIALGELVNSGYTVSAYDNNAIYLTNARQLNMLWPNATMYYNNGYLNASEFVYSTAYNDMARYNNVYNILVNSYGVPVQSGSLAGGGIQTSWWGPGGQYVTLSYGLQTAYNGSPRYYTTLSFGN